MSAESFEERLRKSMEPRAAESGFSQAFKDVKEIVDSVEKTLNKGQPTHKIRIRPVLGFEARIGRQVSVKVVIPDQSFQDGLFRVYIPSEGYPVQLDLYAEELVTCDDLQQMQDELLNFLGQDEMKDRLQQMQEYASQSPE